MSDLSYQPLVYRKQGGSYLVIASGGVLEVESGGTLTVDSGGSFANKGSIISSSAGYVKDTVTAHTTAGAINRYGISTVGSSTAGARAYTLAAPTSTYKGTTKFVYCRGSTGACTLSCTAGTIMNTKHKITFGASGDGVSIALVASSSSNWSIVGYSTTWTTTVKCT